MKPVTAAIALVLSVGLTVPTAGSANAAPPQAAMPLPWQLDYAGAVSKAQAQHQHLVVLLTAKDSEPCRQLEEESLADPLIRGALADMVWVRLPGDDAIERQLKLRERPTLAFVNPFTGSVLHSTSGHQTVELLAREIVHARRVIGLPLSPPLEAVAKRMFSFDEAAANQLLAAGNAAALKELLAPAANDGSRRAHYLVAEITLPEGMVPDDVRFLAGTDCLVGTDHSAHAADPSLVAARPPDLGTSCAEYPLPDSRLLLVPIAREDGPRADVRITAPDCRLISDTVHFAGPAPDTAVQVRRYKLTRLTDATAARLTGRVRQPDGLPAANAIVRIEDWYTPAADATTLPAPVVTRTDAAGRFTFPRVSPGRWLVRAEYPGGEREQVVDIQPKGITDCELNLTAVTTVGLRWTLQTQEMVQNLAGKSVQTGEAFVSVASSRITLAWGMRVRTADYSDLMLAQTPLADNSLPAGTLGSLENLPVGTPIWYLFDAAYKEDFLAISGLHRETRGFDSITTVSDGDPLPDEDWIILGPVIPQALAATQEKNTFFRFIRGEPVRKGDVFTLRCVMRNCFAKLEVTDVTIVTPPASPVSR